MGFTCKICCLQHPEARLESVENIGCQFWFSLLLTDEASGLESNPLAGHAPGSLS